MANIEEVSGVYGGVKLEENTQGNTEDNYLAQFEFKPNAEQNLPAKRSFWDKFKSKLFYEVKIELTPYGQKVENEINDFLHQEITWQKVKDFLFQDITFGKKKEN